MLNGIEFSQLRSRRPNIDYTGLERFSVRGLLDWVQKRVKGTSTYVIASNKCHTLTRTRRRAIKFHNNHNPFILFVVLGPGPVETFQTGGYVTRVFRHTHTHTHTT